MKVTLAILPQWSSENPPLGITYIATALKNAGHTVNLFDLNVELRARLNKKHRDLWNPDEFYRWINEDLFFENILPVIQSKMTGLLDTLIETEPDMFGFSVFHTNWNSTIFAIRYLKSLKTNIKVVVGGPNIKSSPFEENIKNELIDYVIFNEGEKTIVELCSRLETKQPVFNLKGVACRNNNGEVIIGENPDNLDMDKLPIPDFSFLDLEKYQRWQIPINMSRGCVAHCDFCNERTLWPGFRMRSAPHIFKELIENSLFNDFVVNDSLINGNYSILEELLDLIIAEPLNIFWGGSARPDRRLKFELFLKMKQAGIGYLIYGLESGSNRILKNMKKGITREMVAQNITDAHKAGIKVMINIIVGYPGETEDDFNETLYFIKKYRPFIYKINSSIFVMPNEAFYSRNRSKFGFSGDYDLLNWEMENNTRSIREERMKELKQLISSQLLLQKASIISRLTHSVFPIISFFTDRIRISHKSATYWMVFFWGRIKKKYFY